MNLAALLPLITGQAGQGLASAAMGPQMPQSAPQMAQAQPQQMPQGMPQQRKGLFGGVGSPFRNFLGALGDALLVANGGQPMYQQRLQQKRMGEALGNYLGKINADPALMELIQADPSLGMQMYQATRPKQAEPTALQRNYEYLRSVKPDLADQYLTGQAEGAPLIANNGDGTFTIVPRNLVGGRQASGGPQPGTVEDGFRFKGGDPSKQENWEPVNGGPTPSASGGFR